ncbi:alanine/glycine transport protein [Klebsiella pneumoniae]|uniref:Alanine/glycine transport protein n=1 Tax=Klebsiella pneumoniae TaxID=573 RepID=A0A2X3D408_KLEPN|nr:alanine/glycine transport protein [Klebsiella pneumoniae]
MSDFLSFINEILWGSVMIYLLLGAGIWFSWQTRGIPVSLRAQIRPQSKKKPAPAAGWLNVLSGALYQPCSPGRQRQSCRGDAGDRAGGPGAVFWMWVSALLGMASSFAECSLAQLYKERDSRGQFRGGPAWYMARGLGMRWMGVLFSLLLLLAYGFIFNTVQANSVAHALRYAFDSAGGGQRRRAGRCRFAGDPPWFTRRGASDAMDRSLYGAVVDRHQPAHRPVAHHRPADDFRHHLSLRLRLAGGRRRARWATPSARR